MGGDGATQGDGSGVVAKTEHSDGGGAMELEGMCAWCRATPGEYPVTIGDGVYHGCRECVRHQLPHYEFQDTSLAHRETLIIRFQVPFERTMDESASSSTPFVIEFTLADIPEFCRRPPPADPNEEMELGEQARYGSGYGSGRMVPLTAVQREQRARRQEEARKREREHDQKAAAAMHRAFEESPIRLELTAFASNINFNKVRPQGHQFRVEAEIGHTQPFVLLSQQPRPDVSAALRPPSLPVLPPRALLDRLVPGSKEARWLKLAHDEIDKRARSPEDIALLRSRLFIPDNWDDLYPGMRVAICDYAGETFMKPERKAAIRAIGPTMRRSRHAAAAAAAAAASASADSKPRRRRGARTSSSSESEGTETDSDARSDDSSPPRRRTRQTRAAEKLQPYPSSPPAAAAAAAAAAGVAATPSSSPSLDSRPPRRSRAKPSAAAAAGTGTTAVSNSATTVTRESAVGGNPAASGEAAAGDGPTLPTLPPWWMGEVGAQSLLASSKPAGENLMPLPNDPVLALYGPHRNVVVSPNPPLPDADHSFVAISRLSHGSLIHPFLCDLI
jgi:hypothetical protein